MLKIPAIHYGSIFVILLAWISLINHAKCQEALICSSSTTTITLGYESKHYKYPGSGATYPQSSTCKWLFQASDTSTQIMFKVDKLYVDCGDIFVFYSGTSPSGTKIGSEICCSSTCSGASRNDQTSAGRDLFLQFISDSSTSTPGDEAGFELYITVGKDASQCSSSSNTALALTATSTPALLTSPNFFNFYSENYNCTYTYTAATSGNIVTFQFIYLQVELHAGTCYDFVALYDGASSSSTQIASPFCGDTYQPNLIYNSTGNMMTVYFVSTAGVPKRGFSALVYETDSGATTSGAVDTTTSTVETTSTSETVTTANGSSLGNSSSSTDNSDSGCEEGCIAAVVIVVIVAVGGAGGGGGVLYYKYSYKATVGPEKEPGIKDTQVTNRNDMLKQENIENKDNSSIRMENEINENNAHTKENNIYTNDNNISTSENIATNENNALTNGNSASANENIT